MAYDPELDELIEDLGPIGDTGMKAEIRRYDGGAKKLNVVREVARKGKETVRVKVFRMSLAHSHKLAEFIIANVDEE